MKKHVRLYTLDDYNATKKVLEDNHISSKDLDKYITLKALRYARYREENNYTDEEMLNIINDETIQTKETNK